jgi:hypothetical protein
MNAARILSEVKRAGVEVSLRGDNLLLKAESKPSPELLARLRKAKGEIVLLLKKEAGDIPGLASLSGCSRQGCAAAEGDLPPSEPPAPVASLEERRAAVERTRDEMAAEIEARRGWYREPVAGWREGKLEWRSLMTGERTVIYLPPKEPRR